MHKKNTSVQSTLAAKGHAETCLHVQGMWWGPGNALPLLLLGQCSCVIFGGKIWVLSFKFFATVMYIVCQLYCQFTTFFLFKVYVYIPTFSFSLNWGTLEPFLFSVEATGKLLVHVTIPNSSHEERTVPETPNGAASANCNILVLPVTLEWNSAICQGTLCSI